MDAGLGRKETPLRMLLIFVSVGFILLWAKARAQLKSCATKKRPASALANAGRSFYIKRLTIDQLLRL
ncbi:hypothetical protein L0337_39535 [candidate division KSB1 bacterium]|nr:hypothetical protein [candidate division KSB1 bacterium]